jgi:glycosyltransferase involved in cell wall biosynthesis
VSRLLPGRQLTLLNLAEHRGVTYATEVGIRNAEGPVITIVDSDDRILPSSLVTGVRPFEFPDVGFVWTAFMTSKNRAGWSGPKPEGKTLYHSLMSGWWRASHQKFFRKSAYSRALPLNTMIDRASDFQLVLLLALTGCKCLHVPEITYWYRMNRPGSITSEGSERQKKAVEQIKQWVKEQIRVRGVHEPVQ